MPTATAPTIHGLPVMSPQEAHEAGFQSITTDIHSEKEPRILAGVCQHRDPKRAVLIRNYPTGNTYQLAIHREDVSNLEE